MGIFEKKSEEPTTSMASACCRKLSIETERVADEAITPDSSALTDMTNNMSPPSLRHTSGFVASTPPRTSHERFVRRTIIVARPAPQPKTPHRAASSQPPQARARLYRAASRGENAF